MSRQIVLNFHGIGTPHRSLPEDELPYWITIDQFDRVLETIEQARAQGVEIGLTFDDGNQSDYEIALPRLQSRGLSAEFFVLVARLDDGRYLQADQLRQMLDAGMEIGLHGREHIDWRAADAETLLSETAIARQELATRLGRPVNTVAIPFGSYNRRVLSYLRRLDFTTIYTSDSGMCHMGATIRERTSIRRDTDADNLDQILHDRYSLKHKTRRAISQTLRRHVL